MEAERGSVKAEVTGCEHRNPVVIGAGRRIATGKLLAAPSGHETVTYRTTLEHGATLAPLLQLTIADRAMTP